MNKAGQNNYKGINSQAWAAMSLFLQFVRARTLEKIILESPGLQDFILVFSDGNRLICESKDYQESIRHPKIKEILDSVIKNKQFVDKDEVLIIASKFSQEIKNDIENYKYWGRVIEPRLQKKGFQRKHFDLLPHIRLWEVPPIENHKIVYALFAELLGVWLPQEELEAKIDSLIVKKIYENSAKGGEYSRKELMEEIDKLQKNAIKHSGYFDDERVKLESQLANILQAIEDNKRPEWATNQLASLTAQPNKMFFVVDRFKNKTKLNLSDWNELWESCTVNFYPSYLFDIFEKNLETQSNRKYAIEFISKTIPTISSYYKSSFLEVDMVKICSKIIENDKQLNDKVFGVVKQLIEIDKNDFFYIKSKGDRKWEKEEICKLFKKVYEIGDKKLKAKIIKLIFDFYNLVEDDGKFWHYTPPAIFEIVKQYVDDNIEDRILELKKITIGQYLEFYKKFGKKLEFEGWELMGGGISQMGSDFSIDDKHFLTKVIKPVLGDYYTKNRKGAWQFIKKNFIARNESEVSKDKPDFLNRAAITKLLQEYKTRKHQEEAFKILSNFLKMRKGIPWKNELIFQALNTKDFTDEQKWKLVKVSLKEFENLPTNVFIEQIVFNIASKPSKLAEKAGDVITKWVKNPKYNASRVIGSYGPIDGIFELFKNNFNRGYNLLKNYLLTKDFIEKTDTFETYDVAKAIAKVIDLDLGKGLDILNSIYSSPQKLTINQQIAICSGIYNISDNKPERLLDIYLKFLKPKLKDLLKIKDDNEINSFKNIKTIEGKFDHRYSRESLIQFAEKLAKVSKKNYLDAALWLLKVFIHDNDPPKDGSNYSDDPKGEFNRHLMIKKGEDDHSIQAVRGYCCWVIQKLVILRNPETTNQTRKIIKELIPILRNLAFDGNYYIRLQSCIPLIELVKNRHTHLPGKPKERFIPEELAKNIEKLSFDMLHDKNNQKLKAVMKHLTMVFSYMRTLGTKRAMYTLKTFLASKYDEVIDEISPLIIYYALFRKNAFSNWPWEKLETFKEKPFKKLLENQLKKGVLSIRARLAWQFERLPDEIKNTPEEKRTLSLFNAVKLSAKYLLKLTNKYDHEVFNDIYRFIEEYIEEYFNVCFKLWIRCINREAKFFKDLSDNKLQEMYWWPFFYNGKVLVSIAQRSGIDEFLKWFKKLADYPVKVYIANDLDLAVDYLITIKSEKYKNEIVNLFSKLIQRNPKYYDYKQKWLKN